ncbi:hypothetical protein HPB48_004537 [Haemaphysalis longicornis]|uniref:Uncharacterized protein n=1 Tax=Haemaphysalis longicornis TaxID=44386 RepID=A0A9J6G0V3_HAELO|nr:hypothetical protein HPB48_004537 [Haemaphysalis longicornis]
MKWQKGPLNENMALKPWTFCEMRSTTPPIPTNEHTASGVKDDRADTQDCNLQLYKRQQRLRKPVKEAETLGKTTGTGYGHQTTGELIIPGHFNGHLSELDGHMDLSARHGLDCLGGGRLAEDLQLSILNLGQFMQCARGSATTTDYALISHGHADDCRVCMVDEEGLRSVGSDHNRLCLQFGTAGFKRKSQRKRDIGKYPPSTATEKVCEDFEGSPSRHATASHEDFATALQKATEHRMVQDRRSDEARKNAWWDDEVEIAWKERRRANREHRWALKTGSAEAWRSLPDDLIAKSFKKTGISNAMDGSEDDQFWECNLEVASDLDDGSSDSEEE